ncbi:bicaudal D-related protein homolog [Hyalella azteca]|uniref:Bicaudal D-related protein homolog n=1 Tax=Hyalella azteca TaxID=294128 RepID=A0A8B7NXE5_HYAAZ|nr:bicaudal D-related protein homolog [Hyalella azteca]
MPSGVDDTTYELEDYIYQMQCEANRTTADDDEEDGPKDPEADLAKRENDLVMAAELGKALLKRNDDLVRDNEQMAEEFSRKLEQLEQDKHLLRRKLASTEGEYEVRLLELTSDLQIITKELEDYKESGKATDRERSLIIEELTEQNLRLTNELKESCRQEELLAAQVQQLKEKMSLRQSSMTDHMTTLESLRTEIMRLTDKKLELERRLEGLVVEREGLSMTLDESSDRIMQLERQKEEHQIELRVKERDLEEMRHTNLSLSDRLEAVSRASSSPSMGHTSLMNEMELSENEVSRPHSHQDLLEMEEDIECEDPVLTPHSDAEVLKRMKGEVGDAVSQLRVLADQLRQRRNSLTSLSTNSSDDFSVANVNPGLLSGTVKELKGLVRTRLLREAQGQCGACGGKTGPDDPKGLLEKECHKALEAVDKLSLELQEVKDKLKAKTCEAEKLSGEVTVQEAQQAALQEERDNLRRDLQNTHLARDEIVKRAWDSRDQAVGRKNKCEIELARTRIDLMAVNSQLLEAITQKVELSQQLEQWQQDMQQLLDDQMRTKLSRHELSLGEGNLTDSDSSTSEKNTPRKSTRRFFNLLNILRK